jgi:hypothetical protein
MTVSWSVLLSFCLPPSFPRADLSFKKFLDKNIHADYIGLPCYGTS